ncbi:MAG: NUDIX domain-containing protein [Oscillospiraceae bacterium]|nr:NUDIX domain-containing protein [Oscillospiraceae bacterium]
MAELWLAQKSIILYNRKVLLIQRSNYASGENDWEIPGGGLRFGEDLLEGLHREIREETGLSVYGEKLLYAMTALVSPQRQIVGLTYLSYADSDEVTLSHEHKDYVWASRKQLVELLNKPMLDDFEKHSILDILDID